MMLFQDLFQDSSDSLVHFKKKSDSLIIMISFIVFYAYNSNSFTYLKQKKKKKKKCFILTCLA